MRKTKNAMTIIHSLGESTLNPRSGFACEKGGKDEISPRCPRGDNGIQGEGQGI